jgi:hypothetical protein
MRSVAATPDARNFTAPVQSISVGGNKIKQEQTEGTEMKTNRILGGVNWQAFVLSVPSVPSVSSCLKLTNVKIKNAVKLHLHFSWRKVLTCGAKKLN